MLSIDTLVKTFPAARGEQTGRVFAVDEISVGDRVMFSSAQRIRVPANARGLGMVFQSYAIWPHMNVYKNVAFPLEVLPRRQRPGRKALRERVERALATVRLDELASRQATD